MNLLKIDQGTNINRKRILQTHGSYNSGTQIMYIKQLECGKGYLFKDLSEFYIYLYVQKNVLKNYLKSKKLNDSKVLKYHEFNFNDKKNIFT